jgi:hypothetical protein
MSLRDVVIISLQGIRLNVNSIVRREMCKIKKTLVYSLVTI